MKKNNKKIKFKNLNWFCKIGVLGGFTLVTIWSIAFIYGFIIGLI